MEIIALTILFLSMILQVIIPPIPAELIVLASGKLNGILLTTLFGGAGLFIGSVIVYYVGYYIQQKFAKFFKKEKVKLVIKNLRKQENILLLIRLLPYNPSDIISYVSGIIKINKHKFIAITFLTSFIRTFILALMGTKITDFRTALTITSLLIICAIITYGFTYRRMK